MTLIDHKYETNNHQNQYKYESELKQSTYD